MKVQKIGIYPFKIKSYESDKTAALSISSLFLFLQECAWENAMENGFGYEFMEQENSFWVLSRVKLLVEYWPKWKDEIQIKTWPRGTEGLYAIRDFEVTSDNMVIVRVSSSWLILDKASRRPRKLSYFDFAQGNFPKEKAMDGEIEKVALPKEIHLVHQRQVYSSDIDVNGHVNNATYVRWISDAFNHINMLIVKGYVINFLSELMLGNSFEVYYGTSVDGIVFLIKNDSGKEICRAQIIT